MESINITRRDVNKLMCDLDPYKDSDPDGTVCGLARSERVQERQTNYLKYLFKEDAKGMEGSNCFTNL